MCALASESSRCSVGFRTSLETAVNTSFVEGVALMRDEVDVSFPQNAQDSLLISRTEALDACVLAGGNDTLYGVDGPQQDIIKMNDDASALNTRLDVDTVAGMPLAGFDIGLLYLKNGWEQERNSWSLVSVESEWGQESGEYYGFNYQNERYSGVSYYFRVKHILDCAIVASDTWFGVAVSYKTGWSDGSGCPQDYGPNDRLSVPTFMLIYTHARMPGRYGDDCRHVDPFTWRDAILFPIGLLLLSRASRSRPELPFMTE